MRALRLRHDWRTDSPGAADIAPALLPLLAAIDRRGSLQVAARELGLSYRHAWGVIVASHGLLGASLVKLERGRGATLTALGMELVRADRDAARQLAPHFARIEHKLTATVAQHAAARHAALVVHASHDVALEHLRDLADGSQRPRLELHFKGSLESLESLARRHCDLAGFHVPYKIGADAARQYRRWLKPSSFALYHLYDREQGLVVARGNPHRIHGLRDLARDGVRFVNRQPGSGTRLLLDTLLTSARVAPSGIRGYATEEFTHGAVAAMIASGVADAGFAIAEVARQHKLDFVPLAREHYLLAARTESTGLPAIAELTALLRGQKFRRHVGRLAGYDAAHCGEPARYEDVLHG
jgi:molybdate transport repressor ModE-like protein